MKPKTKIILVLILGVMSLMGATQHTVGALARYSVYCANGKLEVDSRSLEQMKSARNGNVCRLDEFDSLAEAEKYASSHGGKGSPCKCP